MQTKKLLPGYLFLASDDPTQLTEQCKKNHMIAKNDELILLNDQDMGLFSLTKNGIFELSKGIIVNGKLKIIFLGSELREFSFEDAKSFCGELAAAKKNGTCKWIRILQK